MPHTASVPPPVFTPDLGPDSQSADLDLDLDLGPESPTEVTRALPASADISLEPVLDFEPPSLLDAGSTQPAAMLASPPSTGDDGIDFDLDSLSIEDSVPKTMPLPRADVGGKGLDFGDFGLSAPEPRTVSMGRSPSAPPEMPPIDEDGDPLARKLELAEEFRQIGDVEGARDLIEEVIAKADGMLKSKAQVMLDGLA